MKFATLSAAFPVVKAFALDLTVLVGLAVMAYGFWLAWKPLGFILGGLMLAVLFGLLSYRNDVRNAAGFVRRRVN